MNKSLRYPITMNEIKIDSVDIYQLSASSIRKKSGYIWQYSSALKIKN